MTTNTNRARRAPIANVPTARQRAPISHRLREALEILHHGHALGGEHRFRAPLYRAVVYARV